jgi:hypothetical protein
METITTEGFEPVHIETDPWTLGRYVEGFYIPNVHRGIKRPEPRRQSSYLSRPTMPLETALSALAAAEVPVDGSILEGLDRALALKRERVEDSPEDRRDLEVALAAGEITARAFDAKAGKVMAPKVPVSERRASIRRAASDAYFEAHRTLAAIGDDLIAGPLAAVCEEELDDPRAPRAEDRWAAMWAAVDALRKGGFASYVALVPRIAELYTYPHRARAWQLAEAQRRDRNAVEAVDAVRQGKFAVNYRRVRPNLRHLAIDATTLRVATEHRDEWGAKLQTASDIDANLEHIQAAERAVA